MRSDLESNRTRDINIISGKLGTRRQKAQGDIVLNELLPNSCIDPNGADRIVTLPPFEAGLFFLITNIGTANTLTVKDSNAVTIEVLSPGEGQWFYSDGYKWYREGIDPGSIIGVFGPAGPSHSTGLVPDPGPVAGLDRALFDDGTWKTITASGAVDAYKQITDGTNTAVAQGLTQFKLRSSSGAVTIAVAENDATHGDNANFGINGAAIPISGLGGYVANEHINHSTVVLTAGSGLSGGGDITASRTFNLDLNDLIVDVPVPADSIAFFDASGGDTNKSTITSLAGAVDHNALLNWVANKHIDHSLVSITAGTGLSGGGDITTSRVLSLDINGLTLDTIGTGDFIPFYDTSGADTNKSAVTGTGPVALQTSPQFNVDIRPLSNDAASLGLSGTAWSDVFLANGAVVNFNAGALLLTHSTGFLTLSGGALKVPDDPYSDTLWDGNFEVPTKNAIRDKIVTMGSGGIPEAPIDGQQYGRQSSAWTVITGSGSVTPSDTTPLMDGTGAAGTSAQYSRGDHRHPTDTSRAAVSHTHAESDVTNLVSDLAAKAPLASPVFTGDPQAPTPATADNDTSIATTAFVKAQGYGAAVAPATVAPLMDGVAAVGTVAKYAKEDHVHPTDTSRAAASALPVAATATPLVESGSGTVGVSAKYAREDHVHPAGGGGGGREVLTANRTYYIRTDGNDSNNGLADTAGGAFLTIQKGIDAACSIDAGVFVVTVKVADGTYITPAAIKPKPYIGAGPFFIEGNVTTPSACLVQSASPSYAFDAIAAGNWEIKGFKITNSVGGGIQASRGPTVLALGVMEYGGIGSSHHIRCQTAASLSITGVYSITGGGTNHLRVQNGGQISFNGGMTHTVVGTPNFITEFCHAELGGGILFNGGTTYSGAATGTRYSVTLNAAVNVLGAGANFFPGSVAGTTATGGQYA